MHTEQGYAYYPLTLYDAMFKDATVVMGWLVEGALDIKLLDSALNRLVSKWPMLSGRLELTESSLLQVKVPLGTAPLPAGYAPFTLTSRISDVPITDYVQLPLPVASDVLPSSLFMDSSAPKSPSAWVINKLPLTLWNLTYLTKGDQKYTCIGVTFPHGLFDGMGIASVIHALEAESLNKPWTVPFPLHIGPNENQLQVFLDQTEREMRKREDAIPNDYRAVSVYGLWLVITFMLWNLWQDKWHKARPRLILMPARVYERLVKDARAAIAQEIKTDIRLSTGDVLTAWLYKTIYSGDENMHSRINLSNMASLRLLSDGALDQYAHNCFIPIAYPLFTIAELKATPIHTLAYKLASARSTLSIGQALCVYDHLKDCAKPRESLFDAKFVVPYHVDADENLCMSNMSIARVADVNWRGLGGGRTLCRYKSLITGSPILMSNIVTIAGRLDDGAIILDVVLNSRRMKCLEDEVHRLLDQTSL